jgi:hypothetical protein
VITFEDVMRSEPTAIAGDEEEEAKFHDLFLKQIR